LGRELLKIGEIARLFRAGLDGGKCQIQLMLHGAGDAVQLPDELFEFFGAAEVQAAIPEKAEGQDQENGQADGQSRKNDGDKQRVEGRDGWRHWEPRISRMHKIRIPLRGSRDKRRLTVDS